MELPSTPLRFVFLAVALTILALFFHFRPEDPARNGGAYALVSSTLDWSNAGHYFQSDHGSVRNLPGDYGAYYLASLATGVQKFLTGKPARIATVHWLQFVLFGVVAGLFTLTIVPQNFSVAGLLCLCAGFPLGIFPISVYGQWAPPLAVTITLVFLLSLAIQMPRRSLGWILYSIACGSVVGILRLWRSDAGLIPTVAIVISLGFIALQVLSAGFLVQKDDSNALRRRLAALGPVLLFLVAIYVPSAVAALHLRAHQASTRIQHFAPDSSTPGHSIWHPLYLGLGAIENPYGLDYSDVIGFRHAEIDNPALGGYGRVNIWHMSSEYDRSVRNLYLRAWRKDPRFVVQSYLHKAWRLLRVQRRGLLGLFSLALLMSIPLSEAAWRSHACPYGSLILTTTAVSAALPSILTVVDPTSHSYYMLALKATLLFGPVLYFAAISLRTSPVPRRFAPISFALAVLMTGAIVLITATGVVLLVVRADHTRKEYLEDVLHLEPREILQELSRAKPRFEPTVPTVFAGDLSDRERRSYAEAIARKTGPGSLQRIEYLGGSAPRVSILSILWFPHEFILIAEPQADLPPSGTWSVCLCQTEPEEHSSTPVPVRGDRCAGCDIFFSSKQSAVDETSGVLVAIPTGKEFDDSSEPAGYDEMLIRYATDEGVVTVARGFAPERLDREVSP